MRRSTAGLVFAVCAVIAAISSVNVVQAALTKPLPPMAFDDSFSVPEDTAAQVTHPGVLGNDRNRDLAPGPLKAVLISTTGHGVLTLRPDGTVNYTPARDFYGLDVFAYAATDGRRTSQPAIVAITVVPVNDPPVAVDDRVTFVRLRSIKVNVVANDFDVDGAVYASTVTIVSPPQKGKVSVGSNGTIIYTPMKGFTGTDSFSYVVWDDEGARSNPAVVHLERR